MEIINVAEICPATASLGPGRRFVIWVQGCPFACKNCTSPDWVPRKESHLISSKNLADLILSTPNIQGLTISGGEPMLQPAALLELVEFVKKEKDLSVICFTGFTMQQLSSQNNHSIDRFMETIDVLIDGQYVPELNDNRGWRGSSNQKIHFLTPRYKANASMFLERHRSIEIHIRDDHALMVGVPPKSFERKLESTIEQAMLLLNDGKEDSK